MMRAVTAGRLAGTAEVVAGPCSRRARSARASSLSSGTALDGLVRGEHAAAENRDEQLGEAPCGRLVEQVEPVFERAGHCRAVVDQVEGQVEHGDRARHGQPPRVVRCVDVVEPHVEQRRAGGVANWIEQFDQPLEGHLLGA